MPKLLRSKFSTRVEVADSGDRVHSIRRNSSRTLPRQFARRTVVLLGVVVAGVVRRQLGICRVEVEGPSMLPTLAPGERLLARRVRSIRPGDLAVFPHPEDHSVLVVKRVVGRADDGLVVLGDNEGASTDSRHFGTVPPASILGIAFYRYAPPGATGWLPRGRAGD